jgi:predicted  nucleic acid-binding Zn-ribbon protein
MQPNPETEDLGSASDILKQTEAHYTRAISALDELVRRIEQGDIVANREAQETATDLRKAMQTFFDERKKVEEQFRRDPGVVHAVALDFDRARAEIGGRLARLRK